MSHAGQTLHYQLPQYEGTDIINPLVDTNDAYSAIDEAIYNVASAAATAVQTANEVKDDIEGTGGVDSRISALVTRMDAVETKNVEQDTSILGVQQAIATTNGNVATNTQNIADVTATVQGHTTSIGNLSTRVQACENADTALDVRVTALENAPSPSMPTAEDVSFDNTASGMTATNVQDAVDELASKGVVYTLVERKIGKFGNDDLYEKSYKLTGDVTDGQIVDATLTDSYVKEVVSIGGSMRTNSSSVVTLPIGFGTTYTVNLQLVPSGLQFVKSGSITLTEEVITIRYTKAT